MSLSQRSRLLFLTNEFRYPTGTGAQVRISHLLRAYSRRFDVTLVGSDFLSADPDALADFLSGHRIRARFVPYDPPKDPGILSPSRWLKPKALQSFDGQPYRKEVTRLVVEVGPFDLIHVCRFAMTAAVAHDLSHRKLARHYVHDLDSSEHSARRRQAIVHDGPWLSRLKVRMEPLRVGAFERRYIRRFDRVFLSSRTELEAMRGRTRLKNLCLVPNGCEAPDPRRQTHPEEDKPFVILFMGTLAYHPNEQALDFLRHEVMPRLVEANIPFELWHAGSAPDELRRKYEGVPRLRLLGFVPDVSELYQRAHVVVAPIFHGGGTRIKVLEAAAHGLPVVSTSFGALDLRLRDGIEIVLGDRGMEFSSAVLRLLESPVLRTAMGKAAQAAVRKNHSWASAGELLLKAVEELLPDYPNTLHPTPSLV